jgi:hypothetical protein
MVETLIGDWLAPDGGAAVVEDVRRISSISSDLWPYLKTNQEQNVCGYRLPYTYTTINEYTRIHVCMKVNDVLEPSTSFTTTTTSSDIVNRRNSARAHIPT